MTDPRFIDDDDPPTDAERLEDALFEAAFALHIVLEREPVDPEALPAVALKAAKGALDLALVAYGILSDPEPTSTLEEGLAALTRKADQEKTDGG